MKVRLSPSQKIEVSGSKDVYKIMREVLMREHKVDRSKEHFWIVCLSRNSKLLLIELISFGSSTQTVVEPTEVFSFALQKKASQLIMVHNHPHGSLQPSHPDRHLTEKMAAIGKFVRLPVVDHLIITETEYFSFNDSGLLDEIIKETHYDLSFSQIDQLKEQMRLTEMWAKKKVERTEREAEKKLLQRDEMLKASRQIVKQKDEKLKEKDERLKKAVDEKKKALAEKKSAVEENKRLKKLLTLRK